MKHFTKLLAVILCTAISFSMSAQTVYPHYNDGQAYIKIYNHYPLGKVLTDEVNVGNVPFLAKIAAKYGITKVRRPFYRSGSLEMRQVYHVYFNNYAMINDLMREAKSDATVEYAERVPILKTTLTPNDLGTQSWTNGNWSLFMINAQGAWDNTTGSPTNTQVAIVDNAVQITHTDLSANIYTNPGEVANNGVDDDGNGYIDDVNGWDTGDNDNNPMPPNTSYDHGTHCAGIASATTNNGTGVASIGYSVKIIPVKATGNADGANSVSAGYEGVDYAISAGADIISMSWGGGGSSQTAQNLYNYANTQGILCIAAAGNDNVNTVFYPAGYTNVMSVASTGNGGSNDQKSSFSNYGTWIDISAPGANIRSTVPTSTYGMMSGTSMACPLVAGLAGLIHSINPNLTPAQIENCIESTATNINSSNSSYVGQLGAGRINAQAATACALATVNPYDASILSVNSPSGAACVTTFTPQVTLKNSGLNTLTAVTIGWQVDGGAVTNYSWTGTLASQAQVNVTLPNITVAPGNHTYTATSGNTVNGNQNDGNNTNNTATGAFSALSSTGQVLPFFDDFETGTFATKGWTVVNPDVASTWGIATTAGQQAGTKSATVNFYNYATTGERDGLVTPTLNLQGLSSATLSFEYAYKRYNNNGTPSPTDSLVVLVSTNCGATYPFRIFVGGENGSGNFATAASSATEFVPGVTDDWCFGAAPGVSVCPSIALTQFLGQSIRIKFESWNNYGNNLYIDDVNITGVTAIQPPTPSFTASTTTICAGQSITFNSTTTGNPTSILWTFPGGSPGTSTQTSQAVTFANPGTYVVTLAATNQGGTNTTTQTITVNAIPSITVTPATAAICAGSNVVLTASGGTTYTWSPATGLSGTTGATVTANPTTTQTYTITGTTSGCSGTTTKTVTVTPLPVVTVTPANTTICAGGSVVLTATGGTTYTWSPATGLSGTTGATVTASPTGTQTYTITGTTNGCSGTTTKTVTVNPAPTLTATAVDNSLCAGESTVLNVTGGGTYTWTGSGLSGNSGASVTATPSQTTTYNVSSTVSGCTGTTTVSVTVNQLPTVGVSASNNNLCSGSPSTLTATGATNFTWSGGTIGGQTTNPITVNPTQTTTYTVTGVDGNGCSDSETITVNVSGTAPSLSAETNKDTICLGTTITLNAQGATNYSWTGDGLNSASGDEVTANPTQTTTFVVSSSDGGCNATAQITVVVNLPPATPSISINNNMLVSSPGTYYQWYLDGQPINGATNQAYTPTQDGNYTVEITDANGCTSMSNPFPYTTGVSEAAFGGKVNIYPNPAFNEAFIDIAMNKPSDISIRLFNSVGQNLGGLESVESLGGRFALPINGLPAGIYMVEINAGGKQLVKKLVLTK
jgi:subtilisin family serine protease